MKTKFVALFTMVTLGLGACAPDFAEEDPADNIGRAQQPLTGTLAYRGVNLCGAEFGVDAWGVGALPGTFGTNYTYPDPAYVSSYQSLDYFMSKGMTTFRIPFRWERLQPRRGEALDATELARLKTTVGRILGKGGAAILDPQNFGRYGTDTIGSSAVPNSQFADFWARLANEFKTNQNVLFNLVNEPHDMITEQWAWAANAAIASIRETGATNMILVPGNAWTGAHAWSGTWYGTPNSQAMLSIVDPGNNMAFEVHQYLDSDSGGGGSECVSSTIGSQRMAGFTSWLRANGKKGFLGEFGGPATSTCAAAMDDILKHLEANADVYVGWTAWAGGPWWNNYQLSMEPKSSGDTMQMNAIEPHLTTITSTPTPTPTEPPPSGTCSPGTYEAESMTKSTGGATSGGWNVWSNGSLSTTRTFYAGTTTLTVYAAGQAAGGVWPHMVVSVGGTVIGAANVTSTSYAPYAFSFDATDGTKEIRITFDNDAIVGTEDRNLLVDKVVVGCPSSSTEPPPPPPPAPTCTNQTFEAESSMTKSTGTAMSGGWDFGTNGYASTDATFADGPATIVVSAAGTANNKTYAHFVVTVGGTRIGDAYTTSSTFREYSFPLTATAGTREIRVTYDNDVSNKRGDRDLYLDQVSVRCP
jgi:endoglucanase